MKTPRKDREGMALLTVLLLVAVMSVVAVAVLDDVRFSVRRATNAETLAQAQWMAAGAETLARARIGRIIQTNGMRTPLDPEWNGRRLEFPTETGSVAATLSDGQNCFNLNSVVEGQGEDLYAREAGVAQFIALGRALDLPQGRMAELADSLVDWLDDDVQPRPLGAEDAEYAGRASPYRTAEVMLAEVSELRAIKGVDAAVYARLRPWVCALPTTRMSPINVNTLTSEQAPLLVMLSGGTLPLNQAQAAIAARPRAGWASVDAFWAQPMLRDRPMDAAAREQVTLLTTFFDLRIDVDHAGTHAVRTALLEATPGGQVRTVIRRWIPEE